MDLCGAIPTVIPISDGNLHGGNVLDILQLVRDAFYVIDYGYVGFKRCVRSIWLAPFLSAQQIANS